MSKQENKSHNKEPVVVSSSLRDDIFKITLKKEKEPEDNNQLENDLNKLNDFSTESEVLKSLSSLLPKKVLIGEKSFNLDKLVKFDGMLGYLIFHSINKFHSYVFKMDVPFTGSVETDINSMGGLEFNFIALEEKYIDSLKLIAKIVLKNFKLFETVDIFRKNADIIKKINTDKKNDLAFFINDAGEFENINSFMLKNKEEIIKMPTSIFGIENMEKVINGIEEMEDDIEEFLALKILKKI